MYCKLTNRNLQTHNGFQWTLKEWYTIDPICRARTEHLCTTAWFHCYNHPIIAVLLNPIHADIEKPRLFRCNVKGMKKTDSGLKFGFTYMRLAEELTLPEVTAAQCNRLIRLCVSEIDQAKRDTSWNIERSPGTYSTGIVIHEMAQTAIKTGHPLDLIALAKKAMKVE